MTTGIGVPFSNLALCELKFLQNSMMLRPRWPSAGPIGGDGLAAPAGTCNFRNPVTFLAMSHSVSGADVDGLAARLTSHVFTSPPVEPAADVAIASRPVRTQAR